MIDRKKLAEPIIDETIKKKNRAETPKAKIELKKQIHIYNIGDDIISSKLKMKPGEKRATPNMNFRVKARQNKIPKN